MSPPMLSPGTYCLRCSAPDPRETSGRQVVTYTCAACGASEPRALILDNHVRTAEEPRGLKHWTAGALIEHDGRFLLLKKRTWPYLWDVIAGHIQISETPERAVAREVEEETGLHLVQPALVFHGEIFPDPCRRGVNLHEWYLYRGGATGELRAEPREVSELRWVTIEEMVGLPFVRPAYCLFDALRLWDERNKKSGKKPVRDRTGGVMKKRTRA